MPPSTSGPKKDGSGRRGPGKPRAAPAQEGDPARSLKGDNVFDRIVATDHAKVDVRQTVIHHTELSEDEEERRKQQGELKDLKQAIRQKCRDLERLVEQPAPHTGNPFLFMQSFDVLDAPRFFGREQVLHELLEHLGSSHTTFLDGTGKTSVLQAGVIPALLKGGHLPLMVEVSAEPLETSIKKQLLRNLESMPFLKNMSLAEFMYRAAGMLEAKAHLFVLVDRFEAMFSHPAAEREAFQSAWRTCVSGEIPRVHWLFSLPSHLTYQLSLFKDKAAANPNLVTLHPLERDQARQVIHGQAALGQVQVDEDVAAAILDELDATHSGRIDPAQLQLVCYMLAGGKGPLVQHWTMEHYRSQGGAPGILREYLDRTISALEPGEREPAWQLLAALIDESGAVASEAELVQKMKRGGVSEEITRQVLLDLQSSHLVEYTSAYTLASENLRLQVQAWRDKRAASEKMKEEVARQVRGVGASAMRGQLGGAIGFMLAYWLLPYIERVPLSDPAAFLEWYFFLLALRLFVGAWAGFMMILGIDLVLASLKGEQKVYRLPLAMLAGGLSFALALVLHTILGSFRQDLFTALALAALEGLLWGAAAGAAALWAILSPRRLWLSLLAGSAACGLVLALADTLLKGLDVAAPFPVLFLAGMIMPLFLIGSALLGRPPNREAWTP
jgi:hypothetical protein